MSKSSSVYTRVEPLVKEEAEQVLAKLGIPMSNAINMFLHQIILHKGIPFFLSIPQPKPLDYSTLSREQFNAEIKMGISSMESGKVTSAKKVRAKMQRQYDV